MSTPAAAVAARALGGLSRAVLSRGTFGHHATYCARLSSVRSLALTSRSLAKSKEEEEDEVPAAPIKFSTSKASHRTWKVDRGLGSQYERPLWKVLPISVFGAIFILWCALRSESDIDAKLEKKLYEHFPDMLPDDEEEEGVPNKSS